MKCKYEDNGVWAGRCKGTEELDPCIGYERCSAFKPNYVTNADHMRAMSDEELENAIRKIAICFEPWCDKHCKMNGDDNCNVCLKNWLKAPYKEKEE